MRTAPSASTRSTVAIFPKMERGVQREKVRQKWQNPPLVLRKLAPRTGIVASDGQDDGRRMVARGRRDGGGSGRDGIELRAHARS